MSVLLAMPCYGGVMHIGAVRALLGMSDLVDDYLIAAGESAITRGRSNLVSTFLKSDYDTLFMLDADCEIDREGVERLIALDKPIRGAAVSLKTRDHTELLSAYRGDARCTRLEMGDDPFPVQYLGGACMMIERYVLEQLYQNLPKLHYDDPVHGAGSHLFKEMIVGGALLTEDYAFCQRARNAGFTIWCHPQVIVAHHEGRSSWVF